MANDSKNSLNNIPAFVSEWTDEYFHKSAFDIPIKYPSKKTIGFLSQFRKKCDIVLYRGMNKYNKDNELVTSWTYDKKIARGYAQNSNKVVKRIFTEKDILLDTTILDAKQRQFLGYDYEFDDKEVLVFSNSY